MVTLRVPVLLRLGMLVAFACASLPSLVQACPVCFGDPESAETKAAGAAVIFMLAATAGVLGGFAIFFVYLMRRSRLTLDDPASGSEGLVNRTTNDSAKDSIND